ncbi:MAG: hypothetical protein LUD07_09035 [Clostridiales bacterium]|nr:hypothetical protein [Clostridiales bacterium]
MGLTVQVKAELEELAGTCIRLGDGEQPEMIWLKEHYERFRSMEGIFKKNEADELSRKSVWMKRGSDTRNPV